MKNTLKELKYKVGKEMTVKLPQDHNDLRTSLKK